MTSNGIQRDVFNGLKADACGRDQTAVIMRRLGYQQVPAAARRRAAQRRLLGRLSLIALLTLAIVGSWHTFGTSSAVRMPTGPTVPRALHQTIQSQQYRFNRTMDTIRSLTPATVPAASELDDEQGVQDDIDRSFVALVRWL